MEQRHAAIKKKVTAFRSPCDRRSAPILGSHLLCPLSRTSPTMTPSWISTLMQLTASPWKDISIKEPATPLRPGAGTGLAHFIFFLAYKCFFSSFFPFPGAGFQFRKTSWCIRRNSRYVLNVANKGVEQERGDFCYFTCLSGAAYSRGGGPAALHGQKQH